jgi:uncharacterized DUF497 family protein
MYTCSVAEELTFDWDKENTRHLAAHGITPDEVEQFFANEPVDLNFDVVGDEERWASIGHTNLLRVLIVVWAMRNGSVRCITAFEAGKARRTEYFGSKGF